MTRFKAKNRLGILYIPVTLFFVIGCLMIISSVWASQHDVSGPPSEFFNSQLAMKTDKGFSHLGIRLAEFLMGIQTDKTWEKRNDNLWILRTSFNDPVVEVHKTYVLEFEKMDSLIVLSAVSFDNRILSYSELESFTRHIIQNFGKHVSPK